MVWFITGNLSSNGRNTGEQYSNMVQAWQLRGSKSTHIWLTMVVLQSGTSYPTLPVDRTNLQGERGPGVHLGMDLAGKV